MNARPFFAWTTAAATLSLAGCGLAYNPPSNPGDGGTGADGSTIECLPGQTSPDYCLSADANHVCGDVGYPRECVDGHWQCPSGTGGECWCYGLEVHGPDCICTPSGWSCPSIDAGVIDAGPVCPLDPAAAVGTPCTPEGQSCGTCSEPCSVCHLLVCQGGVWQDLEVIPDCQPVFGCGPTSCVRSTEYCVHTLSDIGGVPDDYRCQPLPAGCSSCECLGATGGPWGPSCSDDGAGAVTIVQGGG